MTVSSLAVQMTSPTQHVRELVCTYRPLRDASGRIIDSPALSLNTPRTAAVALAPLITDQVVEVFGVACVSTRLHLLAWHILSRGTRSGTSVSMPDVFVPACVVPGTTGVIVLHNHPSGDPIPSADDIALTKRLQSAGAVLDIPLLDHLIVGEGGRYYSFRERGHIDAPRSRI
jgi:DNA repair protein RadC